MGGGKLMYEACSIQIALFLFIIKTIIDNTHIGFNALLYFQNSLPVYGLVIPETFNHHE